MTEPSAMRPSTRSSPSDRAFPTRRAFVGGAAVAGAVGALTYQPTLDRPWTRLTGKAPWSPRDGAALLAHNERLWVFGGSASNQILDVGDGWSSVNGIDWRKEVDRAGWTPSIQSMSVTFAGRLWRMGGFVVQGSQVLPIGEIWSSADGRTWTLATAAPAWRPRGGGALVVHNGRLWLLGGTRQRNEGDQPALGDVWSTENGVDWTEVAANAPWKPRAFHSVIVHNGRLWVMGGGHWGKNPMFYGDVWSSLDGIKWTEHPSKGACPAVSGQLLRPTEDCFGLWEAPSAHAAEAPMTPGIPTMAETGIPIWRQSHGRRVERRIPPSSSTINCWCSPGQMATISMTSGRSKSKGMKFSPAQV